MSAAATSAEPLVLVEGVHTYYGKSHILHGVSLTVGAGEVVGLLGRNSQLAVMATTKKPTPISVISPTTA